MIFNQPAKMTVTIISKHDRILVIYLPFKNICSQNETKEIVVNLILSCAQRLLEGPCQ